MPKFKLQCVHESDNGVESTVTFEFEKEFLNEVVEEMEQFLRGCGYYFEGRNLDFVEEEVYSVPEKQYDFQPLEDAFRRMREDAHARTMAEQTDCV